MLVLTNGGTQVPTSSTEILQSESYGTNLIIVSNPSNTKTIWISLGGSKKGDTLVVAEVNKGIPLAPGGSLNLADVFGIIGVSVVAISEGTSQNISWIYL